MRRGIVIASMLLTAAIGSAQVPDHLVLVAGGTFKNVKSNYYGKHVRVSSFYLGKYEVTQEEWVEVMGSNPSKFVGDNLPVEEISWYEAVEYCNRRSIKEGFEPYYTIDKSKNDANNLPDPKFGDLDKVKWTVTLNPRANGYRLPTEAEWEYAAGGGQLSNNYTYSGSNDVDEVAWYWRNAGDIKLAGFWTWSEIEQNHDQTKPVGEKKPNELGLYDMSGNVREWCWDWFAAELPANATDPKGSGKGTGRVWRGGGWIGDAPFTESAFRGSLAANGTGPDQGLRVARNK
jgi:formylglycine-generating enzyme required for sulfatase activity